MNNFKNKVTNFFKRLYINSYGLDEFGKLLFIVGLACDIINLFVRSYVLYSISLILLFYFLFRFFSRKKYKRAEENRRYRRAVKYLNLVWTNRKTHRILVCKGCGQFIRVPKGQGKIEVTCPHCGKKIDFRS